MIHQTIIYLTFLLFIVSLIMANPCPCELVVNENPMISKPDTAIRQLSAEDSIIEDSVEPVPAANVQSTDKYEDLTNSYPFIRQIKSLSTARKRFKRPSWATIGKRSSISIKKRPAWVTIG
jgi:hypothetical protein